MNGLGVLCKFNEIDIKAPFYFHENNTFLNETSLLFQFFLTYITSFFEPVQS